MKQLYLITLANTEFYFAAKSLAEVAEMYPQAKNVKWIADEVVVNSGERYDLLKEAYDYINSGANTYTLEVRQSLVERIKKHLF